MQKLTVITLLTLCIITTIHSVPSAQNKPKNIESALFALGEKYQNLKEYELAKKYLHLAVQKGNTDALVNLGAIYYIEKQISKSTSFLKKAIDAGHSNAFIILCHLENRESDAQKFLNELPKEKQISLAYSSAMILKNMGFTQPAINLFLQARTDQYSFVWFQIGTIFDKQGNYKQAESYYKEAINRGEKYLSPRKLANLYKKQKQFDLAQEYYNIGLEAIDYIYTWLDLADLYYLQGKYELSKKCLEKKYSFSKYLQKETPPSEIKPLLKKRDAIYAKVDALNLVGNAYFDQKEYENAIEYFNTAIHYEPNFASFANLGNIYFINNEFDAAEIQYKQALSNAIFPSDEAYILCSLGYLYQTQQNNDLAIEHFKLATEKGNALAAFELGFLYFKEKKYDLAEEPLKFAVDNQIKSAVSVLGGVYDMQDKWYLASIFYKFAVDNGDTNALHHLGSVYIFLKKLDLAEHYLKKALSYDKSALFTLGKVYFARQNFDQAEYYYKQALKENLAGAQEHLDSIAKLKKDPKQAKAIFKLWREEGVIP